MKRHVLMGPSDGMKVQCELSGARRRMKLKRETSHARGAVYGHKRRHSIPLAIGLA
jgi:hypothetical protein